MPAAPRRRILVRRGGVGRGTAAVSELSDAEGVSWGCMDKGAPVELYGLILHRLPETHLRRKNGGFSGPEIRLVAFSRPSKLRGYHGSWSTIDSYQLGEVLPWSTG